MSEQSRYDVSDFVVKEEQAMPIEEIFIRPGEGDYLIQNIKYGIFFRARRSPYLLCAALQDADSGLFILRDRMTLEFEITNYCLYPVYFLLLYVCCQEEIVSVYPKALHYISSKEDFEYVPPETKRFISLNANQLFHLIDGRRFQFILVVVGEKQEETLKEMIGRIHALNFPLDAETKNLMCLDNVLMTNFVFEKL
jgi:hypothetical protein